MRISATAEQEAALQAARKQISQGVVALNEAESLRARVLAAVREAESKAQAQMTKLNPEDPAAVTALATERTRIGVLVDWYNSAPQLRTGINELAGQLRAVRPLIEETAQMRHLGEHNAAQCAWFAELEGLHVKPELADKLTYVKAVAQRVLNDLNVLCQQRRKCPLTREETFDGVLRDGARAIRRLTHEEIRSGHANI